MSGITEDFDVLIIGAGISGISAAWHVHTRCPGKRYALLEARADLGGTWDYFKYPGVRSDSDMYTLGFRFRPWVDTISLAPGSMIKQYLHDTVQESGIDKNIRYQNRLVHSSWSSEDQQWTVTVEVGEAQEKTTYTTRFLINCSGYYRYDGGFTPQFPGISDYQGTVVHPQNWPEDLDLTGKKVVVIGSGATAITLVPTLAPLADHVTMLQRSPTYVMTLPGRDPFARVINKALPRKIAYAVNRWRAIFQQVITYQLCMFFPKAARAVIRAQAKWQLPKDYPVDVHFKPRYNPWDERVCAVPSGDLFRSIKSGKASIATDTIDTFTENGIRLASGEELEADVVITATGFNLSALGEIPLSVDGEDITISDKFTFNALMLNDVPNYIFTIGYTNASWTLKADLVSEYACRIMNHLDKNGYGSVTPIVDFTTDSDSSSLMGEFTPGYVARSLYSLPKQGDVAPWKLKMNYLFDLNTIRMSKLDLPQLKFLPKKYKSLRHVANNTKAVVKIEASTLSK